MTNDPALEAIYDFICQHWHQFGYGPSLREISAACYISQPNLYRYLDRLQTEGRITRDPNRARSITLLEDCDDPKK